jgi:hypothetical protein
MKVLNLKEVFTFFSKNKITILIFLAILTLGLFLRVYKLGQQSFVADEYLGINASYGYHQSGEWKFWDFNHNRITEDLYTRAKVYYWQVAQAFNFISPTEAHARLISVIWGMIGLVSIFFVSWLVTKNCIIALLSTFLMAVSVSSLTYDRKLRMYSMFVPVYLWLSYALFYFIESKAKKGAIFIKKICEKTRLNWNYFIPVVLLGLLSMATHTLTVNIIPTLLVYLVVMSVVSYKQGDKKNKYTLLFLILVLFIALSLNSKEIQGALFFFSFWINNWSYLQKVTLDYSYMPLAGLFFIIGVYYLLKFRSKIGFWTVISYLVPLSLAIMVWKRNAGHQYILFTQSFKVIIMASGVYFAAKIISEKIFSGSKRWFTGSLFLFLALLLNFPFFFSKDSFYKNPKKWNYSNYREVFNYYLRHRDENSILITRPSTNYYLAGTNTFLIGYNEGEEELTLEKIIQAQQKSDDVWLIFSKTTYIKSDAREYFKKNFSQIETNYTNDQLEIWRWQQSQY